MKKILAVLLLVLLVFSAAGCSKTSNEQTTTTSSQATRFEQALAKAKGTTVNFYGWGGDERTNKWIDTQLAPYLKDHYSITLKRVPMDIDQILNKMLGEKQAGKKDGSIDLVWINGENFYTATKNNLLYGPFTQELPNFNKYLDPTSKEVQYDFGYETKGSESPYGKAEFVLINDSAVTPETPKNAEELLAYAKKYPGKVTYPAPPDFTGSAFVRNIIYDVVGYDKIASLGNDKAKLKETIQPAMDYLKELSPYLWKEGKTYPASIAQVDNMFSDGELVMDMSYNPNAVAGMIATGRFKDTARSFIFDKGMIGNTHFLAIPANASNIDGALVAINAILSPEIQASKYDPKNWGDLPVLENSELNPQEKDQFNKVPLGKGVIPQDQLLAKRLPEMPADLIPAIEEIWQSEIPGKN
ncbi:ABC transporter substrate-binding protein [Desulfitobacterium sp. AusDCA]|uniref:ABC transporter substrate-binding protein n=1 Tax=Desulfitobacterium sp. AusDCA TaxID=3240383 RepID=UPI003DA7044F